MTAGAFVLTSSLICTAVFGLKIWTGLAQSLHDSAIFLERGYYPLYRMISFYARRCARRAYPLGLAF